jgi:hypothetical protein
VKQFWSDLLKVWLAVAAGAGFMAALAAWLL